MDVNDAFPYQDASSKELFEKQQRELNRYTTRYVYAPFRTVSCAQLPGGVVAGGEIVAIPAPRGHIMAALLPDGAQVLELVAPEPGAPKSVAVYLHDVEPIIRGLESQYAREGFVEITALYGMADSAFEANKINDLLFGSPRPVTASAIRARMNEVIAKADGQATKAAQVLAQIAREVLRSVEICAVMASEHVRERHIQIDDPNHDGPKRYSQRDLRAIEFVGAIKREEYLQHVADRQEQATAAIPQMLLVMQEQQRQTTELMGQMAELLKAQTEALKASAGGGESKKK